MTTTSEPTIASMWDEAKTSLRSVHRMLLTHSVSTTKTNSPMTAQRTLKSAGRSQKSSAVESSVETTENATAEASENEIFPIVPRSAKRALISANSSY